MTRETRDGRPGSAPGRVIQWVPGIILAVCATGGFAVAGSNSVGVAQENTYQQPVPGIPDQPRSHDNIRGVPDSAPAKLRAEEDVRRTMDRNNGALQAIYLRALRTNAEIKGTLVLRIVIAADGSVTHAEALSSQLNDPETERKILARIKAIHFGAIDGAAVWDGKYTLNFFFVPA